MRFLKMITLASLILAVTATAGAVGIPFNQAWNGPIYMHMNNLDDSVVYDYNSGKLLNGDPIVLGTAYAPGQVKLLTNGINLKGGESAWGIFQIDQILKGAITGPNGITPAGTGSDELYSVGSSTTDIVGIFYGGSDVSVTFTIDQQTGAPIQNIKGTGYNYEIFTQPEGIYNNGGGTGALTRVDSNEYPTLGYDGFGTNTLLSGAERILTATSQAGMVATEYYSVFDPSVNSGRFNAYLSVGAVTGGLTGTQNVFFDTNVFPTGGFPPFPFVAGTTADFLLEGTTKATNKEWLVSSSDPITTAFVPEPLTMLAVFTGIAGLGGYIRKRRMA